MSEPLRVEICGGIASGKTTLAHVLGSAGSAPMLEDFGSNPFLEKFYKDKDRYAFETEITFLLQHFSCIRETKSTRSIADFSLALDLAYAYVTLEPSDRIPFESVLDRVLQRIGPPSMIVRLHCSGGVELQRIYHRHRAAEQSISLDYLLALEDGIDRALVSEWFCGIQVLSIDSALNDFRPEGADRESVCARIYSAIKGPVPAAPPGRV